MQTSDDLIVERIDMEAASFYEVLRLRASAYEREEAGRVDAIDHHSFHFVARTNHHLVGALRVTCLMHGPLECQEHYPRWLIESFGDRICAASRMCVRPAGESWSRCR